MSVALPSGAMDGGMSLESVLLLSRGILGTCVKHDLVIASLVHMGVHRLMGRLAFVLLSRHDLSPGACTGCG